ncbi:S41 family peptidase [Alteromonas gilva]|uniref:S41 family peptidase n=1 Tax=Alteromonas gilva TaxID=2987522 RepID=A0ABT5L1K5_9ALTE|nr:S41 family peptidase [Alteromonas gilva]MDC8830929.1 S41 family peptidase [Alteromonas gilva]
MKLINLVTIAALMVGAVSHNVRAQVREKPLARQEVTIAVSRLIKWIEKDYIHEIKGEKAVAVLTEALNSGEFNGHFSFGRLKIKLESMLVEATLDSNFELFQPSGLAQTDTLASTVLPGAIQTRVIDNNIGYLAIDGDLLDDRWQTELDIAMASLSGSDALIIDLRTAGFSPLALSQHFLSYFVPTGQRLSEASFAHRKRETLMSHAVNKPVKKEVAVYIVTSPFVAGAWEFVAYTLKHAERATIVGSTTIGLGYMTTSRRLSENLGMRMAYAQIINPETHDNWQGEGVIPDVLCAAREAVAATLLMINHATPQQCETE